MRKIGNVINLDKRPGAYFRDQELILNNANKKENDVPLNFPRELFMKVLISYHICWLRKKVLNFIDSFCKILGGFLDDSLKPCKFFLSQPPTKIKTLDHPHPPPKKSEH